MEKGVVEIYTDGACSPNPGVGGWAAVLISPSHNHFRKEIFGAESDTTNNRMELLAAIKALQSLKFPCIVKLFTDSKYIQQAFSKGWLEKWKKNGWLAANRKPVANQDLWQDLAKLSRIHEVSWIWVKGHSSDQENDRCDFLAVQARQKLADELTSSFR
ncbi:MAG: ribonuclease HI [SAR324 cluster bacterium]|nr:ribonuclease HI [SAR324 cluster bacterium]